MSDKIRVLVVEPMKPCEVREISGLDDMQAIVGGHIEAVYPFQDAIALVCNEEGKNLRNVFSGRCWRGGLRLSDGRSDPEV